MLKKFKIKVKIPPLFIEISGVLVNVSLHTATGSIF